MHPCCKTTTVRNRLLYYTKRRYSNDKPFTIEEKYILPPRQNLHQEPPRVSVDISALNPKTYLGKEQKIEGKEEETPLIADLKNRIKGKNPLPVAEFMKEALTHPTYGYYTSGGYSNAVPVTGDEKVFGVKGDFTTSPEISQLFGEMIGIWCLQTWISIGCPAQFQIVEMGPGRGTLMNDILRSTIGAKTQNPLFQQFRASLKQVTMVEISPTLQRIQKNLLQKSIDGDAFKTYGNTLIEWVSHFDQIPEQLPCIMIFHELFDALPVYQFEYTSRGWCEVMVDIDEEESQKEHFKFVLSPSFTPNVTYLKTIGIDLLQKQEIGTRKEVSPASLLLMQQILHRISTQSGAALLIDYGHYQSSKFTLQGIAKHQFVHPLCQPGKVDLSIFVDFGSLEYTTKEFSKQHPNTAYPVLSHGVQKQGTFLMEMGIDVRLANLLRKQTDEKAMEALVDGYTRLIDDKEMGESYKMLAVSSPLIQEMQGTKLCGFSTAISTTDKNETKI